MTSLSIVHVVRSPIGGIFRHIADLASAQAQLETFLSEVYHLYADYCLKNPFYDLEQPIHNNCEKFVYQLEQVVTKYNEGLQ